MDFLFASCPLAPLRPARKKFHALICLCLMLALLGRLHVASGATDAVSLASAPAAATASCPDALSALPVMAPVAPISSFPASGPMGLGQEIASPADQLTLAFQRAFSDGEQFRQTDLFFCLGYSATQSRAMAEITPRPASMTVTAVPGDQPGEYRSIQVTASAVRYYGMTIAQASFTFPLVRISPQGLEQARLQFLAVPEVIIETHVSDDDLLRVFPFSNRSRQLSNLRLKITDKEIDLRGKVRRSIFLVAFTIRGTPVLNGTKKVDFSCSRMHLNGVSLPRSAIRAMFNHVNPVFDATRTWLNLELTRISTEAGMVHTWARLCPALAQESAPIAAVATRTREAGVVPVAPVSEPQPVSPRPIVERNP